MRISSELRMIFGALKIAQFKSGMLVSLYAKLCFIQQIQIVGFKTANFSIFYKLFNMALQAKNIRMSAKNFCRKEVQCALFCQ